MFWIVCVGVIFIPWVHADIGFVQGKGPGEKPEFDMEQSPHIVISGYISDNDVRRSLDLLETATKASVWRIAENVVPFIILNSPGGDVNAAIRLGRILRSLDALVAVGRNAECSSACVLILAPGAKRIVFADGRIGLHRPYFDEKYFAGLTTSAARGKYAELERLVKEYLHEMGMVEGLFEKMRSIPSRRVAYLTEDEMQYLGLVGTDPAIEELERAKEKQHFSNDSKMYSYLQHLRNCFDVKRSFDACDEIMRTEVH